MEGFDLHDLAKSIGSGGFIVEACESTLSQPPSFGQLSRSEALGWLDALLKCEWLTPIQRDRIGDVRQLVVIGIHFSLRSRKLLIVNEAIAKAYALGIRA